MQGNLRELKEKYKTFYIYFQKNVFKGNWMGKKEKYENMFLYKLPVKIILLPVINIFCQ